MSLSTSTSPIVFGEKPQAKLVSPVCRSLFGRSETSVVTQMLNEIIVADRKRALLKLNFDISQEKPVEQQQQENMVDIDRTPEPRRRYQWRPMRDTDAPEFYSRRYKGKKSLMPVSLLQCAEDSSNAGQNGRSRTARRSLNGYLRSPSKHLSPKAASVIRPSSASRMHLSPLRLSSPAKQTDSPVSFDDSCRSRIQNLSVLRPLPIHASSENVTPAGTKIPSPLKPVLYATSMTTCPSPRRNDSYCARALDFSDGLRTSSSLFRSQTIPNNNSPAAVPSTPSRSESTPLAPSRLSPKTPAQSTSVPVMSAKSLKQLKITDMVAIRKARSPATKARKRLALSHDDSPTNVPSSKKSRLASSEN